MNPVFNIFGCNLIVLAEWKPVCSAATYDNSVGISLITAAGRRNSPQCCDSKIHHCNLINNIVPKIQANHANAADGEEQTRALKHTTALLVVFLMFARSHAPLINQR